VGWIYQYALVDKTGQQDLSQELPTQRSGRPHRRDRRFVII
jgi:hypothetical protein